MKSVIAIGLLTFLSVNTINAQDQKQFQLKGRLSGQPAGILYLNYSDAENKRIKDSCTIVNGGFFFKGNIKEPTMAYLQLKEEKRNELNSVNVFIEPAVMTINLLLNKFKTAKLAGSKTQNENSALEKLKEPVRKQMQPVLDEYTNANNIYTAAVKRKAPEDSLDLLKEKAAAVREKFTPYNKRTDKIDYDFFVKHPNSYVTVYMMRFHVSEWPLDTLQRIYDNMNETVKQSNFGNDLEKEIEELRGGSPGSMAKNFSATDINGNKLALSDLKGKYVLLDFWASWCVPCRKGNPHLKELYAKYKDKGIEFIGVSDDDRNPDAWRKAVEKDGLPWKHVLRGLDMQKRMNGLANETEISDRFGISTLPTKILIDQTGMIIGRFGEEEQGLNQLLQKIFGN